MANVLLVEWDAAIQARLAPLYYGRYVDDMFLVMRDSGTLHNSAEVMNHIADLLPKRMLSRGRGKKGVRRLRVGAYQGHSELFLQDDKHRLFFLSGPAGSDLLRVIRREITDLASERRMLPEPQALTTSPAAQALTASESAREAADSLRRADGLSIRRMGWAVQLRHAETLALDLPPSEWAEVRCAFYRFAQDHVLRAECILDYFDYLPRLIGLAVACRDWAKAREMFDAVDEALRVLEGCCGQASGGTEVNGCRVESGLKDVWTGMRETAREAVLRAVVAAWPWERHEDGSRPDAVGAGARELLESLGAGGEDIGASAMRLVESDLARTALKEHRRMYGPPMVWEVAPAGVEAIKACRREDVAVIEEFLAYTREKRLSCESEYDAGALGSEDEPILAYLFPTRPYTASELAELDERCLDVLSAKEGASEGTAHWADVVGAFRGLWTRSESLSEDVPPRDEASRVDVVSVGRPKNRSSCRLCLGHLTISDRCWHASAAGTPMLTQQRYAQVARLVNCVLRAKARPDYLLLPELALPRAWVRSVANRLLQSRISLVSGTEYEHLRGGGVHNSAVLSLVDDRLGFTSSVRIWQQKSAPAPVEEEELLTKHGKQLIGGASARPPRVYRHEGLDFGLLICSELQDVRLRSIFRGEVDSLIVLAWNKDLETFCSLVESAALDVHAYVALANNGRYGDSRVRCPAKEAYLRDVCRIRGGLDEYAVTVEIEIDPLRCFQSRHKNWPRPTDQFKPVPQGYKIARRRWKCPGDSE